MSPLTTIDLAGFSHKSNFYIFNFPDGGYRRFSLCLGVKFIFIKKYNKIKGMQYLDNDLFVLSEGGDIYKYELIESDTSQSRVDEYFLKHREDISYDDLKTHQLIEY